MESFPSQPPHFTWATTIPQGQPHCTLGWATIVFYLGNHCTSGGNHSVPWDEKLLILDSFSNHHHTCLPWATTVHKSKSKMKKTCWSTVLNSKIMFSLDLAKKGLYCSGGCKSGKDVTLQHIFHECHTWLEILSAPKVAGVQEADNPLHSFIFWTPGVQQQ